jgi:hypothetical protein
MHNHLVEPGIEGREVTSQQYGGSMVMVTKITIVALSSFWSLLYLSFKKLIGSLDGSKHNPKSSKSKQQRYVQQQNYV